MLLRRQGGDGTGGVAGQAVAGVAAVLAEAGDVGGTGLVDAHGIVQQQPHHGRGGTSAMVLPVCLAGGQRSRSGRLLTCALVVGDKSPATCRSGSRRVISLPGRCARFRSIMHQCRLGSGDDGHSGQGSKRAGIVIERSSCGCNGPGLPGALQIGDPRPVLGYPGRLPAAGAPPPSVQRAPWRQVMRGPSDLKKYPQARQAAGRGPAGWPQS